MKGIMGLMAICFGIVLGIAGITYVPQFVDSFFWDFMLRVAYILGVLAIGGGLSIAVALLEVRDSPAQNELQEGPL